MTTNSSVRSEVQIVFPASAVQQHVKDSSTNSFLFYFLDAFQQGATATLLFSLEFSPIGARGCSSFLVFQRMAYRWWAARQGKGKICTLSTKFFLRRGVC